MADPALKVLSSPPVVFDSAVRAAVSRTVASQVSADKVADGCRSAGERGAAIRA